MQVLLGNIAYPKSFSVVVPTNSLGLMTYRTASIIKEAGGLAIEKEARKIVQEQKRTFEPGDVFSTKPGRMRRRGPIIIYHAVLSKTPGGYISIHDVGIAMRNVLFMAIKDEMESITFPPLMAGSSRGIEAGLVASQMFSVGSQFIGKIDIKIVDDDPLFIEKMKGLVNGKYT